MNRSTLIENTLNKIQQLPDNKIQEINEFAEFLLSKAENNIIQKGIQRISSGSTCFEYLKEEEDLYSVKDIKEKYK